MSYYDSGDKTADIIGDIEHGHTPDSIREDAQRELQRRGIDYSPGGYVNYDQPRKPSYE